MKSGANQIIIFNIYINVTNDHPPPSHTHAHTHTHLRVGACTIDICYATFTVGQRRWRTAVSHLPTWRPPKHANKARPGLVYHNHHTLTQMYTQIDMGRSNSVPKNRDLQSLNFVTRTLCIFGGRWRTQRCEVEDSVCFGVGGGGLQFPMHASINLSRYISYVEEFLIGHELSFF